MPPVQVRLGPAMAKASSESARVYRGTIAPEDHGLGGPRSRPVPQEPDNDRWDPIHLLR